MLPRVQGGGRGPQELCDGPMGHGGAGSFLTLRKDKYEKTLLEDV